jgi:hypothetical protein
MHAYMHSPYSTLTACHYLKSVAYGSQQIPCARDALPRQYRIDSCRYIVHNATYLIVLHLIRGQIAIDQLPRRYDIVIAIQHCCKIVYVVARHTMPY